MKCLIPKERCWRHIHGVLGGRIAEELIFGDITTGASQDIKQATHDSQSDGDEVWNVSTKWEWSLYGDDDDEVFIGRDLAHARGLQ
ncbi:MAG: hypothetical protein ACLVBP_03580 [Ruminococcus sp.]